MCLHRIIFEFFVFMDLDCCVCGQGRGRGEGQPVKRTQGQRGYTAVFPAVAVVVAWCL